MKNINPLENFFRKVKYQLTLPSRGKWYPEGSVKLNDNSTVDVYAMTAADDIKFRTGDLGINIKSTVELINSCIPAIKNPEIIPSIDLDSILLAIRYASYGNNMNLTVPVPNTNLTRTIPIDILEILNQVKSVEMWDDTLNIFNENNEKLTVKVKPIPIKNVFANTKTMIKQSQFAQKAIDADEMSDEALNQLDSTIKNLSVLNVAVVNDSIDEIIGDGFVVNTKFEIHNFLNNIDIEYFKAIQSHLEKNRNQFSFETIKILSTNEEITAGAPEEWNAEVTFTGTDFFKVFKELDVQPA